MSNRLPIVPPSDNNVPNPIEALMASLGIATPIQRGESPIEWMDDALNMQPKEGNKVAFKCSTFTNAFTRGRAMMVAINIPGSGNVDERSFNALLEDLKKFLYERIGAFETGEKAKARRN